MEHTTIAVDLAKSVFQVAVSRRAGEVDLERRLSRAQLLRFFAQQPPATVVLEACGSAHHWARELQRLGHAARLLPAHDVHRYVRRNKTDRADTKALLEANRNDEIRPVPVKSIDQQAVASLHRLRSTWMATRTARLNTLRGLCREFGVTIPLGATRVVPAIRAQQSAHPGHLPPALMPLLEVACDEIAALQASLATVDRQLAALATQMPQVQRLQTIPGIGLLTASALVAMLGDARRFPSGRHLASSLGLTAKEASSGTRRRLGAISKQGNAYLRTLLIHGARSVLWAAKAKPSDPLRIWALRTQARRGQNIAAVALANKLARIVWVVWTRECDYDGTRLSAAP